MDNWSCAFRHERQCGGDQSLWAFKHANLLMQKMDITATPFSALDPLRPIMLCNQHHLEYAKWARAVNGVQDITEEELLAFVLSKNSKPTRRIKPTPVITPGVAAFLAKEGVRPPTEEQLFADLSNLVGPGVLPGLVDLLPAGSTVKLPTLPSSRGGEDK